MIKNTDIIINEDGSVYHLHLKPTDIANDIILVGDLSRVDLVSSLFDSIELKKSHREFITHTGLYKGKRITVISTGIGTPNIDIVLQELDFLVNFELYFLEPNNNPKSLNFYRLGTCGTLQTHIEPGTALAAAYAVSMDNLLDFYQLPIADFRIEARNSILKHYPEELNFTVTKASPQLLDKVTPFAEKGIAWVAPGFYAPQGRITRIQPKYRNLNHKISEITFHNLQSTHYEMEVSAIYGLAEIFGHNAIGIDLVLANRNQDKFLYDYKDHMKNLAQNLIDVIAK